MSCLVLLVTEIIPGGAERLVVDAALGLQALGHSVDIYTSHHDPNHCFDETNDGARNIRFRISQNYKPKISQAPFAFMISDLHFLGR